MRSVKPPHSSRQRSAPSGFQRLHQGLRRHQPLLDGQRSAPGTQGLGAVTIFDEAQRHGSRENVEAGDLVYVEARVAQTSYGEGENRTYTVDVVATLFNKL